MPSRFSVILAADIAQCRLIVSGKAGLLPIGSPASCDPTARTHVNHRVNRCVKSCLHPLVHLQCDSSPLETDWTSSDHICAADNPSWNGSLPRTSGLTFLLSLIRMPVCVGFARSQAHHLQLYLLSFSLHLCDVSSQDSMTNLLQCTNCRSSSHVPKSDKELSSAFQSLCLDNLCGEDVTKSELEGY